MELPPPIASTLTPGNSLVNCCKDCVAQCRRDFLGEQLHALARQVVGHVAELELNQEIADLGASRSDPEMRRITVSGLPTMIDCEASSSSQFSHVAQKFSAGLCSA